MGDDLGIMSRRFEIRNVGEAREKGKHSHRNVSSEQASIWEEKNWITMIEISNDFGEQSRLKVDFV